MADSDVEAADEAVYRFMAEAWRRAGTLKNLARIASIGRDTPYDLTSVRMWTLPPFDRQNRPSKRNQAPPAVIARVLIAFPDMSFDAYVRGQVSEATPDAELHARLAKLEESHEQWNAFFKAVLIELGAASGTVDVAALMDRFAREVLHHGEESEDAAEERGS